MLSKLSKTLFASALIALGGFGLSACGDDNSSGTSSIESSDSSTPPDTLSLQGAFESDSLEKETSPKLGSSSSTESSTAESELGTVPGSPEPQLQTEKQEIEMNSCVVDVGTIDSPGIDLMSCTAIPWASADLYFTADELTGVITIHSANGVRITEYTNQKETPYHDDWSSDFLPPEPVHMSDFRFREDALTTVLEGFNSDIFYVAIAPGYNSETGDGFYAFTLQSKAATPEANGNIPITVLIYQK